jgi:MFS family permease
MNLSNSIVSSALLSGERRAAWSLSLIYMVRMLGLFIILPVFSLFGDHYTSSTPFLIGFAIGVYGLLQASLQVPFGMLGDRIGRKRVITIGLTLMAIGSVVAALSDSVYGVILGRALQGTGAIASTLMALAADLTRDEQRTKVMASLGASIGFAFILSLVLGPFLLGWFSIDGLFWITAASDLLGIVILHTAVPNPARCQYSADTGANLATMKRLLGNRQLQRLSLSIFMLHLMITAVFFVVPLQLRDAGIGSDKQWLIYLPSVVIAIGVMVPLIIWGERKAMRAVLLLCVAGLSLTQVLFAGPIILGYAPTVLLLFIAITCFFSFMNTLEALLPSLVSKMAPAAAKGSAMGIYSSSQFFGAFVGGAGAGGLYGAVGPIGVYVFMGGLCLVWGGFLLGFKAPKKMATHRRRLTSDEQSSPSEVLAKLQALEGVEEVVIALEEGVAYLKVDKVRFQGELYG